MYYDKPIRHVSELVITQSKTTGIDLVEPQYHGKKAVEFREMLRLSQARYARKHLLRCRKPHFVTHVVKTIANMREICLEKQAG
jgi:hypothetical protein